MSMSATTGTELAGLLQLASPALPIGGFSYSQGLEAAIDAGYVHDAGSAQRWIADGLQVMARGEAVLLARQCAAWAGADLQQASRLNASLLALRETAELRLEAEQMGASLARLALELGWGAEGLRAHLATLRPAAYVTSYAFSAVALGVRPAHAVTAWLYSWVEGQVAASLKAVPLGQMAGQRMLQALRPDIVAAGEAATSTGDDAVSTFAPMLAILSSRHENQYSRLFRS